MTYQRITVTDWEWQIGNACMTVHYNPSQQQLIWSNTSTINDDSVAQDAENFWEYGPLFADIPAGLLAELRQTIPQPQPRGNQKASRRNNLYAKPGLLKRLLGRK